MKTFVLGAGASLHAGYPLTVDMATSLFVWMQGQDAYRDTADWFRVEFPPIGNIEDLFFGIQIVMDDLENGTLDQKCLRAIMINKRRELIDGLRAWFSEIRNAEATAYRQFAADVVKPGDCIITFNYDVSLDRELHRVGKWEVGDGYGFVVNGLPDKSPTTLLKLHGSTNWLTLLFGGVTSGVVAVPGGALGDRPVIASAEICFLGYDGLHDPLFTRPSAAISPMILPTRSKQFFFDTSFGREWEGLWDSLWGQARQSLENSEEVFVLGYSMASVDERACELLFTSPSREVRIEVSSGSATGSIVQRFKDRGYLNAVGADHTHFEDWVSSKADKT
jgi:hypothetical protein